MIKEATATGATIEEALEKAKAELGAPADAEIHTEVLEMPKKKMFGLLGTTPAKVKASYDAPEEKKPAPKPVRKTEPKAAPAPKAAQPKAAEKAPEVPEEKEPVLTKIEADSKPSIATAVNYLKEIVLGMGAEKADVEVFETESKEIILELDCGDDYGIVIGRRGDTLDSIQYLT
ncbi:MAG: Jag N-terminal domain-containing protein, partial [Acutalibacteraceae bacterium]